MTPAEQGFVRCMWCGTWRRADAAMRVHLDQEFGDLLWKCRDRAWCSSQAGVGKGELTGATP